jgi:hypothetical protein
MHARSASSRPHAPPAAAQVIADDSRGLLFKNKRDRKVLSVDPKAHPGDNSTRTEVADPAYAQVVLFDHVTRRRSYIWGCCHCAACPWSFAVCRLLGHWYSAAVQ